MYASAAPAMALLQQVNGGRPLMQPTKLRPKKNITAMLTAIDLTGNGIIIHFAHLVFSNGNEFLFFGFSRFNLSDRYNFYRLYLSSEDDFIISYNRQQRHRS